MFKRLKRNQIYKDDWLTFFQDEIELPDGEESTYGVVERKNGVNVVVVADNKILLNKEYRYVIDQYSWEIPGGGIDEGETPKQAAKRELLEETGILAESLEKIGTFYPLNSFNTEEITIFYTIIEPTRLSKSNIESTEDVKEQKFIEFEKVLEMIDSGELNDMTSANAIQIVIRKLSQK